MRPQERDDLACVPPALPVRLRDRRNALGRLTLQRGLAWPIGVDATAERVRQMHGSADTLALRRAVELREERGERLGGLNAGAEDVPDEAAGRRTAALPRTRA